jgi:XTP/dITP diphosphohydrolase
MQNLLLGTRNPGKLRELHELLTELDSLEGVNLVELDEAAVFIEVVEDGETYLENASCKARAYSRSSGLISLADDSGLEVDALGGRPGILSARFVPQLAATDADRRAYLLDLLAGYPHPWTARFRCAVAVAQGSDILFSTEGVCEGEVIPFERGSFGFGYDPIFLVGGQGRTMAELEPATKNRVSHRAKAVISILPYLVGYFLRPGAG